MLVGLLTLGYKKHDGRPKEERAQLGKDDAIRDIQSYRYTIT